MSEWDPEPALRALEDWAERIGVQLRVGKPVGAAELAELTRRFRLPGSLVYAPPPSYRRFLARQRSLEVLVPIDGELRVWTGLGVYAPRDAAKVTREVVFVDERREIRTDHLVAFAPHELSPALTTCFVTDRGDERGELPVVVHDQDEPAYARRVDGSPLDAGVWDELPWKSFGDWLDARVSAAVKLSRDDLEI
jgi:hypothetical protein